MTAEINPPTPPIKDPVSAAVNAPASSIPSTAMLTTATRSDSTPANPPSAIGTALTIVACSIPVREKDLPAVAHTRKAKTARTSPKPMESAVHLAPPRKN